MALLLAEDLWKFFGATEALKGVNLSLDRGLHILLGPNGSGKTTLLKIWVGLYKASRGRVETLGLDPWNNRSALQRRVSALFEDLSLPWWVSGLEYLKFISQQKGVKWSQVEELASLFKVDEYWRKPIRGYSSGMRKRILLIQALAGDFEVIILDEPYTLIDKAAIGVLNSVIRELTKRGSTIVIATHMTSILEERVDSVTIIVNGEIVRHYTSSSIERLIAYKCMKDAANTILRKTYNNIEEVIVKERELIVRPGLNSQAIKELSPSCTKYIDLPRAYDEIFEEKQY